MQLIYMKKLTAGKGVLLDIWVGVACSGPDAEGNVLLRRENGSEEIVNIKDGWQIISLFLLLKEFAAMKERATTIYCLII